MSIKNPKTLGEKLKYLAKYDKDKLKKVLSQFTDDEVIDIIYDWDLWKRPSQNYNINWPEQFVMAMCGRG